MSGSRPLNYGIHNPVSISQNRGLPLAEMKYPLPASLLLISCFSESELIIFSKAVSDRSNAILISTGARELYFFMNSNT